MKRTLYHFTSTAHLPAIMRDKALRPSESNIGSPSPDLPPFGLDVGPRVVWLTDTPDLEGLDYGLSGSSVDKTEIRFTVEIPYALKWSEWPEAARMHPEWKQMLLERAGPESAAHWWVLPGRIPAKFWVKVENVKHPEMVYVGDFLVDRYLAEHASDT